MRLILPRGNAKVHEKDSESLKNGFLA